MNRAPFKSKVPAMSAAQHDAWLTAQVARWGLRRGRRFRASVGVVFDPHANAARAALGDVVSKLEAVTRTDVRIGSRATTRALANPDHALHDAIRACDRLIGRRHH